jgi:hypothetical protein
MNLDEFKSSISDEKPPSGLTDSLKALWYDARGDWTRAHEIAQEINTQEGSWIHAYLHRKEGDLGNASYWYHRANRPVRSNPLSEEWDEIVKELLR